MGKLIDMTGRRFGRLRVIERSAIKKGSDAAWLCECDCGVKKVISGRSLRRRATRSCGCLRRDLVRDKFFTHGKKGTPEYNTWCGMKQRCYYAKHKDYHNYGGRGVVVCDRWKTSFVNFLNDMGCKPSPNHSLERLAVNGNYTPDNCIWATSSQQAINKRTNRLVTHPATGETLCVREWERKLEVKEGLIEQRLTTYRWSEERALTTPVYDMDTRKRNEKGVFV